MNLTLDLDIVLLLAGVRPTMNIGSNREYRLHDTFHTERFEPQTRQAF